MRDLVFIGEVIQTNRPRGITVEDFHEFILVDIEGFVKDVRLITFLLGETRVEVELIHVLQSLVGHVTFVHFSSFHQVLEFFFHSWSLELSSFSNFFVGNLELGNFSGLKQCLVVYKLPRKGIESFKDI